MNILFLDDDQKRRIHASNEWAATNKLPLVINVPECIEALGRKDEWDIVSLDHDLEGEVYVDSSRKDCGMEVVRWIEKNEPNVKMFIVHTWNFFAAMEMTKRLRLAGYTVSQNPYIS